MFDGGGGGGPPKFIMGGGSGGFDSIKVIGGGGGGGGCGTGCLGLEPGGSIGAGINTVPAVTPPPKGLSSFTNTNGFNFFVFGLGGPVGAGPNSRLGRTFFAGAGAALFGAIWFYKKIEIRCFGPLLRINANGGGGGGALSKFWTTAVFIGGGVGLLAIGAGDGIALIGGGAWPPIPSIPRGGGAKYWLGSCQPTGGRSGAWPAMPPRKPSGGGAKYWLGSCHPDGPSSCGACP